MKKLLSLTLALVLCVLCLSAACAEQAVSDGTLLELEDFTLALDAGMVYSIGDKDSQNIYVTVYPFTTQGDSSSSIGFTWSGSAYMPTTDEVDANADKIRQSAISGYEAYGITVESLEFSPAVEYTVACVRCAGQDSVTRLVYQSVSLELTERQFFAANGYIITMAAADTETLDRLTDLLGSILTWK